MIVTEHDLLCDKKKQQQNTYIDNLIPDQRFILLFKSEY